MFLDTNVFDLSSRLNPFETVILGYCTRRLTRATFNSYTAKYTNFNFSFYFSQFLSLLAMLFVRRVLMQLPSRSLQFHQLQHIFLSHHNLRPVFVKKHLSILIQGTSLFPLTNYLIFLTAT